MPFKTYIPRQKGQVTLYSIFQNIHSVSVGFGDGPIKEAYHKEKKTEKKSLCMQPHNQFIQVTR
jgi:hypothetical protein